MILKTAQILLTLCIVSSAITAQKPEPLTKFSLVNLSDKHGYIYRVIVDKKNYVWALHDEAIYKIQPLGLNKYKVLDTFPEHAPMYIASDLQNNKWIITNNGYTIKKILHTGEILDDKALGIRISDAIKPVKYIATNNVNSLYIGSRDKLSVIKNGDGQIVGSLINNTLEKNNDTYIKSMEVVNDTTWIFTNKNIYSFAGDMVREINTNRRNILHTSMSPDKTKIYIAELDTGDGIAVSKYSTKKNKLSLIQKLPLDSLSACDMMLGDCHNTVWLAGEIQLSKYDSLNNLIKFAGNKDIEGSFFQNLYNHKHLNPEKNIRINSIAKDTIGNLWVATGAGLYVIPDEKCPPIKKLQLDIFKHWFTPNVNQHQSTPHTYKRNYVEGKFALDSVVLSLSVSNERYKYFRINLRNINTNDTIRLNQIFRVNQFKYHSKTCEKTHTFPKAYRLPKGEYKYLIEIIDYKSKNRVSWIDLKQDIDTIFQITRPNQIYIGNIQPSTTIIPYSSSDKCRIMKLYFTLALRDSTYKAEKFFLTLKNPHGKEILLKKSDMIVGKDSASIHQTLGLIPKSEISLSGKYTLHLTPENDSIEAEDYPFNIDLHNEIKNLESELTEDERYNDRSGKQTIKYSEISLKTTFREPLKKRETFDVYLYNLDKDSIKLKRIRLKPNKKHSTTYEKTLKNVHIIPNEYQIKLIPYNGNILSDSSYLFKIAPKKSWNEIITIAVKPKKQAGYVGGIYFKSKDIIIFTLELKNKITTDDSITINIGWKNLEIPISIHKGNRIGHKTQSLVEVQNMTYDEYAKTKIRQEDIKIIKIPEGILHDKFKVIKKD